MIEGVRLHSRGGWAGAAAMHTDVPAVLSEERLCAWGWLTPAEVN